MKAAFSGNFANLAWLAAQPISELSRCGNGVVLLFVCVRLLEAEASLHEQAVNTVLTQRKYCGRTANDILA